MPAIIIPKDQSYLTFSDLILKRNTYNVRRSIGDIWSISIFAATRRGKLQTVKANVPRCEGAFLNKQEGNSARTLIRVN
jgi:hypothetical protein